MVNHVSQQLGPIHQLFVGMGVPLNICYSQSTRTGQLSNAKSARLTSNFESYNFVNFHGHGCFFVEFFEFFKLICSYTRLSK